MITRTSLIGVAGVLGVLPRHLAPIACGLSYPNLFAACFSSWSPNADPIGLDLVAIDPPLSRLLRNFGCDK